MKKLLSLLVALLLALGGVGAFAEEIVTNEAGAVENPEDIVAGENELIFWSLFSGGEGAVMEAIVADYNATNPEYTCLLYTSLRSACRTSSPLMPGIMMSRMMPSYASDSA